MLWFLACLLAYFHFIILCNLMIASLGINECLYSNRLWIKLTWSAIFNWRSLECNQMRIGFPSLSLLLDWILFRLEFHLYVRNPISRPPFRLTYDKLAWMYMSRVSCQKGPTRHAYAWQIGPFWQDTLDVCLTSSHKHHKWQLVTRVWKCYITYIYL